MYERKNKSEQVQERRARILNWLKRGYTVNYIIQQVMRDDNMTENSAKVFVYDVKKQLYKSNSEMMAEAKDYVINALLGTIEECSSVGDVKSKLQAIKQLSDTAKVTEQPKTEINVNFGFNYGEDD